MSHGSLWKVVLDEFLEQFSARNNIPFRAFDVDLDKLHTIQIDRFCADVDQFDEAVVVAFG